MGSTLLLACLLLSQVRTMVCPACRSIGADGLTAAAAAAAWHNDSTAQHNREKHKPGQAGVWSHRTLITVNHDTLGQRARLSRLDAGRGADRAVMPVDINPISPHCMYVAGGQFTHLLMTMISGPKVSIMVAQSVRVALEAARRLSRPF